MNNSDLQSILDNCPRMVAVFMVMKACGELTKGDIVYWNWRGTFVSHRGDVNIKIPNLEFVGYAPTVMLGDHQWPNLAETVDR